MKNKISYFQSIIKNFRESFVFKGRSSTEEYWRYSGFAIILILLEGIIYSQLVTAFPGSNNLLANAWLLIYIITCLPMNGLSVRRLHDVGRSGWWNLLLLTVIGIIFTFYWSLKKSDPAENKYGATPAHQSKSNIHRNTGITLSMLWLLANIFTAYSDFNSFANWQIESLDESDKDSKTISRLFSSEKKPDHFYKVAFICTKNSEVGIYISPFSSIRNSPMVPLKINNTTNPVSLKFKAADGSQQDSKLHFHYFPDPGNTSGALIEKTILLDLLKNDPTISIDTVTGNVGGGLGALDKSVNKFISECQ